MDGDDGCPGPLIAEGLLLLIVALPAIRGKREEVFREGQRYVAVVDGRVLRHRNIP